jgi:hypothetical protein
MFGVPGTFIGHWLMESCDPNHRVEAWMESWTFGAFEENLLDNYGPKRLHTDHEGEIIQDLVKAINEPVTDRRAWIFLIYPFATSIGLPWVWYDNEFSPTETIEGFPKWAFRFLLANTVGTFCLVIVSFVFWFTKPEHKEKSKKYLNAKRISVTEAAISGGINGGGTRKSSFFGTTIGTGGAVGASATILPATEDEDGLVEGVEFKSATEYNNDNQDPSSPGAAPTKSS